MTSNLKAYYILIGFFLLFITSINAQDQKVADSLSIIYQSKLVKGQERLKLLRSLAFNEMNNLEARLKYSNELIVLASEVHNDTFVYRGYVNKGDTYRLSGDFDKALDALFKSNEAAKRAIFLEGEAVSYNSIADVYSEIGNATNADLYYRKGIEIFRKLDEPIFLASALFNAGDELFNNKKYDKALKNFEEAGLIFKNENYHIGSAYTNGNIGMIYAEQGNHKLAEEKINEAIIVLEEFEDYYAISEYLTYMSDIYLEQNNWEKAVTYAEISLELANKNGLKKQISESNLKLSELHQSSGNITIAFQHFRDYITYRDSVINIETVQKLANQQTDHEVSQKQVEVDLLSQQKKNQRIVMIASIITLFLIGIMAIGLFKRNKFIKATNKIIEKEKERSDELLLNILPEETALELKEFGKVKSQKFESVTVLFTDFEGFTSYSEHLSPEELVETVDFYFSKFDEIIEKHKLEKIKTIGDAYMCAGGLPFPSDDHAHRMVLAAFEIAEFVDKVQKEDEKTNQNFNVRIGINTGPVVSGVVGSKKFAYDIWGDTVNIASRMESNSEIGRVNISENTHELIKNDFNCEYRGEIDAKNKGMMKMYFVNSLKETNKTIEHVTTRF